MARQTKPVKQFGTPQRMRNLAAMEAAQERVDDALNVLARMGHGDPRLNEAISEYAKAQRARREAEGVLPTSREFAATSPRRAAGLQL